MDTREDFDRKIAELCAAGWVHTAVVVALERGLLAGLATGASVPELARVGGLSEDMVRSTLDVLATQGFVQPVGDGYRAAPAVAAARLPWVQADLRSTFGQQARVMAEARDPSADLAGWRTLDPVVVAAQGEVSLDATERMLDALVARTDLGARLGAAGSAALDVGAGAAGVCIALARRFPLTRVVGLEPSPEARAIGAANVQQAGLTERITLRPEAAQDLADTAAFDFGYVAQMFFPQPVLIPAFARVHAAMRPGGMVVTAATCSAGPDLPSAITRFRSGTWGRGVRMAEEVASALTAAGFATVRVMPTTPGAPTPILAFA
jgi:SAM-dependent methyltransferase